MDSKTHGKKISFIKVCDILYIAALLCTFILLFVSIATDKSSPKREAEPFSESWYYDETLTQSADLKHPDKQEGYAAGVPLHYYAEIPDKIQPGNGMLFKAKNGSVKVYMEGEKNPRASYQLHGKIYGKSAGTGWVEFPLYVDDAGKLLHIEFTPYYNDSSCYLGSFYIGQYSDVITSAISGLLSGAVVSILMFAVGIFLIIIFLALRRAAGIFEMDLFYLGFTAVAVASWTLSETKILQFFTANTGALHNFNCMSLMLIPLPILMLYQKAGSKMHQLLINSVAGITVLNIVVSCLLHFTKISDFHENLKLTHITIVIAAAAVIYSNLYTYFHEKQAERKDKVAAVGLIAVAVFGIIDVIRYKSGGTNDSSRFTRIAIFLYILALGVASLEHAAIMVKKGMTADLVSRLAYEDGLTGLGNRTAYQELLSSIAANNRQHNVFMFDINNLKYVNDNIGHSAGDHLITSAANVIEENFGKLGKCYRIGGDEFICISDQPQNPKEILTAFFAAVDQYNKEHSMEFPLVIAAGSARCEKNDDIYHAVEIADKQMYVCKAALKEKYPLEEILVNINLQTVKQ